MIAQALRTLTEHVLDSGSERVVFQGHCNEGRHDGHIVRIVVDVLCGCDECITRRAIHDEICTSKHHTLHDLEHDNDDEQDDNDDDDDDDNPDADNWKK